MSGADDTSLERKAKRQKCKTEINLIKQVYQVLIKPKGFRLRILKYLYPEIVRVADKLRGYH